MKFFIKHLGDREISVLNIPELRNSLPKHLGATKFLVAPIYWNIKALEKKNYNYYRVVVMVAVVCGGGGGMYKAGDKNSKKIGPKKSDQKISVQHEFHGKFLSNISS